MNMRKNLIKKGLVVTVILLFIVASVVPSINGDNVFDELDVGTSGTFFNEGSLSGYVNDTNMDPIEGALVRVYFHEAYEEDYSDSTGYYHVTDIPICNCTKNCTASKEEYITEWVWLSIGENTTYDFVLEEDDSDLVEITIEMYGIKVPETDKRRTPPMLARVLCAHINGTVTKVNQRFNLFDKIIIGFHAEVIYLKVKTVWGGSFELIPGRFWYEFWAHIIIKEFTEIGDDAWYIDAIAIPFMWQTWPN